MNPVEVNKYTELFLKFIRCDSKYSEKDVEIFIDLISKTSQDKQRIKYLISQFMDEINKPENKKLSKEDIINRKSKEIINQMNSKTKVSNIKPLRGLIKQFRGTGEDCGHITDYGKRCKNAFVYSNPETKKSKDCTDYCQKYIGDNCSKFMEEILTNLLFGEIKLMNDNKKIKEIMDLNLMKRSQVTIVGRDTNSDPDDENEFEFHVEFDILSEVLEMKFVIGGIEIGLYRTKFEDVNVYKSKCLSFIRENVIPDLCKSDEIKFQTRFNNIHLDSYLRESSIPVKFKFGDITHVYKDIKTIKKRSASTQVGSDFKLGGKEIREVEFPLFKEQKESKDCSFIKDLLNRLIFEDFNTTKGQEVKKSTVSLKFKNIGKNCSLELYYDGGNQTDTINFSTSFYNQENVFIHIEDDNIVVPGRISKRIMDVIYKSMCYVKGIMYIEITLDEDIDEKGENKNVKINFTDDLTLKSYKDEELEDNILSFKYPLEKVDENKIIKWTKKRDELDVKIIGETDRKDYDIIERNDEIIEKILGV